MDRRGETTTRSLPRSPGPAGSAEGERESLHVAVEKLDLERPLDDRLGRTNELIEPRLGDPAVALLIDIEAVGVSWRFSVDRDAEASRGPAHGRAHHQVEVARLKAVRDAPTRPVEHDRPCLDGPVANEGPVIECEARRGRIDPPRAEARPTGRCEVRGSLGAEVVFRRPQTPPVSFRFEAAAHDRDGLATN